MKKRAVFIVLLVLGLVFFACDFNIPKAIEFRGSPTVRFVQNVPLGEKFTGILAEKIEEEKIEGMTILPCENTENYTDIIHMELFNEILESDSDQPDLSNFPGSELGGLFSTEDTVTLTENKNLIDKFNNDPMEVPFSSVGVLLEGFEFTGHKIELYVSGSSIVDKAKIDMKFETIEDGSVIGTKEYLGKGPINGKSNIETWTNEGYTATEPPSGGIEIDDLPLDGKDLAVYFRVYIPSGEELSVDELLEGNVKVEVVVWLPFTFKAVGDDGATIDFPKDALFSSEEDLFGRDKPGADSMMTDIIESLNLVIKFDKNPFLNSKLIIRSETENDNFIEITNDKLTDNNFPFIVSKENMDKINLPENWPFTPNFKMKFDRGDTLEFPKEFSATEFIFNAKIKYRMDL